MNKNYTLKVLTSLLLVAVLNVGCNDIKEEYYARPAWLEPSIYQQLEERGNFTDYLYLVDQANYTSTLSSASSFTAFVPTDDAFERYLTMKGLNSIEELDSALGRNIVRYSIAYNGYFKDELDDFQDTQSDTSQQYDVAFKRETPCYNWVYSENIEGVKTYVVDINGVGELPGEYSYNSSDNNNKHIPFFTSSFFSKKNLSAYDYNYFYPDKTYSGFNVCNASVIENDLRAENGVIHIIDEVVEPLANLETILATAPEYSSFFQLIDLYSKDYYLAPDDIQDRYSQFSGSRENVYVKYYEELNFAPNCENFLKYASSGATHDAQKDGWTLFAPKNQAVNDFVEHTLLKHYASLDQLPSGLISEFVNAHLFRTTVWPSKFDITTNYYGEPARFDPESNVLRREVGSNGIFYGTNIIQETDAFYTILGEIILDPQYSMYVSALRSLNLYDILKNPKFKFTVFLINNDMFKRIGLDINNTTGSWELTNPNLGSNATLALDRVLKMNIFLNKEYPNFMGDEMLETYGGEYVRMFQGMLYGAGNYQTGQIVYPYSPNDDATNGVTYQIDKGYKMPLYYSVKEIGYDIEFNIENYGKFYDYLEKADKSWPGLLYSVEDQVINGVKSTEKNTLIIPTDTAMDGAVRDGYLPEITDLPFTAAELKMVSDFVYYHVLNGQIIVTGNGFDGEIRTLRKNEDGTSTLQVESLDDNIIIVDDYNHDVNIIYSKSNVLSNNAVIHLSDNYLKYKK